MSDTVTVYHPTIRDVSSEVAKADVDRWVEQGWKKTEPAALKAEREAAEKARLDAIASPE
jgi:hypothetical protein